MRYLRLALYLYAARWLPASTMPGGRLWRALRRMVAGPLLASRGEDVNIEHGAFFGTGDRVHLGSRSSIGINCRIHGPVRIGRDVMIGPDVMIYALGHQTARTDVPMIDQGFVEPSEVTIGDDVWVGARSIILPGVVIADGVIVGAGSVVTKSVPPYTLVAGNPARVVRSRVAGDGSSAAI